MIFINTIKIVILIVLCGYSSITDIKHGIIKNTAILAALSMGLFLDIIGWCVFDAVFFKYQIINIVIVALISVLFYAFHIWAGGDCKLVLALIFLIPYELYIPIFNEWTSLIILLVIIFNVSYLYLIFDSIVLFIKRKHIISKQKLLNGIKTFLKKWICCVSYIILLDTLLLSLLPDLFNKFKFFIVIINVCTIFVISGIKFLQNKFLVIGIIVAGIATSAMLKQPIFSKFMLINFSIVVLLIILRLFIDEYNLDTIETSKVKKGMILSAYTTIQFANSKVKGLPNQSTEDLRSRLTESEAESVRRWEKSKYGTSTVQIIRKIPFAIFISLGTIIYLILGATM